MSVNDSVGGLLEYEEQCSNHVRTNESCFDSPVGLTSGASPNVYDNDRTEGEKEDKNSLSLSESNDEKQEARPERYNEHNRCHIPKGHLLTYIDLLNRLSRFAGRDDNIQTLTESETFSSIQHRLSSHLNRPLQTRYEFHLAILSRDYITLAMLLKSAYRESINELDALGRSPLHLALISADTVAVQLLLGLPFIRPKEKSPSPPQEDASSNLYLESPEDMSLSTVADLDFPDLTFNFGALPVFHLPLAAAASSQSLNQGAVLKTYTLLLGYTALATSVIDNSTSAIDQDHYQIFMESCGWNLSITDSSFGCALDRFRVFVESLFFATDMEDKQTLWSIDSADDEGSTALHFACSLGNHQVAAQLLKYGANPFCKVIDKKEPEYHNTVANFLHEAYVQDHNGFLAIHRAIHSRHQLTFTVVLRASLEVLKTYRSSSYGHSDEETAYLNHQMQLTELLKHCVMGGAWACLDALLEDPKYATWPMSEEEYGALMDFAHLCGVEDEFKDHVKLFPDATLRTSGTVLPCGIDQLCIFTHDACFDHIPLSHKGDLTSIKKLKSFFKYPENPSRLHCLVSESSGVLHSATLANARWCSNARPANIADILRVHDWNYIHTLVNAFKTAARDPLEVSGALASDAQKEVEKDYKQVHNLDADTVITRNSWKAACSAAGCAIAAVDAVCSGVTRRAFCAIRPPGHHVGTFGPCQPPNFDILQDRLVSLKDEEDWLALIVFFVKLLHNTSFLTSKLSNGMSVSVFRHGSQGFCLLNNVAIAAAYARYKYGERGIRRIAIVDFDIHHGNGTQQIVMNLRPRQRKLLFHHLRKTSGIQLDLHYTTEFWKPWLDTTDFEEVFFVSIHGFGDRFYPNTGGEEFRFQYPNIWNIHLPPHGTRTDFRAAFLERLIRPLVAFGPAVQEDSTSSKKKPCFWVFNTDLILVSAGFDGHHHDLVNDMFASCCEWDFQWLTRLLVAVANEYSEGRIVSVLEGGYNSKAGPLSPLAQSVFHHVQALLYTPLSLHLAEAKLLHQCMAMPCIPSSGAVTTRRRKRAAAVRAMALLSHMDENDDEQRSIAKATFS